MTSNTDFVVWMFISCVALVPSVWVLAARATSEHSGIDCGFGYDFPAGAKLGDEEVIRRAWGYIRGMPVEMKEQGASYAEYYVCMPYAHTVKRMIEKAPQPDGVVMRWTWRGGAGVVVVQRDADISHWEQTVREEESNDDCEGDCESDGCCDSEESGATGEATTAPLLYIRRIPVNDGDVMTMPCAATESHA